MNLFIYFLLGVRLALVIHLLWRTGLACHLGSNATYTFRLSEEVSEIEKKTFLYHAFILPKTHLPEPCRLDSQWWWHGLCPMLVPPSRSSRLWLLQSPRQWWCWPGGVHWHSIETSGLPHRRQWCPATVRVGFTPCWGHCLPSCPLLRQSLYTEALLSCSLLNTNQCNPRLSKTPTSSQMALRSAVFSHTANSWGFSYCNHVFGYCSYCFPWHKLIGSPSGLLPQPSHWPYTGWHRRPSLETAPGSGHGTYTWLASPISMKKISISPSGGWGKRFG